MSPSESLPFGIGELPAYLRVFSFGDVQLIAVSIEPLSAEQQAELEHRCSFPLDWPLNPPIEVVSNGPAKPVYDNAGRLIGTAAEVIELPDLSQRGPSEGGGA